MVEHEISAGLRGNASDGVRAGAATTGRESRQLTAGRAARLALTAALLSSTALIAAGGAAHAQAVSTWTGAFGSTDWGDEDNWDANPADGDNIVIPGLVGGAGSDPVFTGSGVTTIGSLTVKGSDTLLSDWDGSLTITVDKLTAGGAVSLSAGIDGNSGGIISINGATASLVGQSTLTISSGASSAFRILEGFASFDGLTTVSAGNLYVGDGVESAIFTSKGGLIVNGGAISVEGTGATVTVGDSGVGDFKVSSGGALFRGATTVEGLTEITGGVVNIDGSSNPNVAFTSKGGLIVNGGTIEVGGTGATVTVGDSGLGDFKVSSGSAGFQGGATTVEGLTEITGGGVGIGNSSNPNVAFTSKGGLTVAGGAINVYGTGTTVTVGDSGAGDFKVSSGSAGFWGGTTTVEGLTEVTGGGVGIGISSTFTSKGGLTVAGGTISVQSTGATVTVGDSGLGDFKVSSGNALFLGGTTTVEGLTNITGGSVAIGDAADSTVVFEARGGLSVAGTALNVTGKDTTVTVGTTAGDGARDLTVTSTGWLILNTDATLDVTGNAVIASGGNASASYGNLNVAGNLELTGELLALGTVNITGETRVGTDADAGYLAVAGLFNAGDTVTVANGSLSFSGGGSLNVGTVDAQKSLVVSDGGTLSIQSTGAGNGVTVHANLDVSGAKGSITVNGKLDVKGAATITDRGAGFGIGSEFIVGGGLTLTNGATNAFVSQGAVTVAGLTRVGTVGPDAADVKVGNLTVVGDDSFFKAEGGLTVDNGVLRVANTVADEGLLVGKDAANTANLTINRQGALDISGNDNALVKVFGNLYVNATGDAAAPAGPVIVDRGTLHVVGGTATIDGRAVVVGYGSSNAEFVVSEDEGDGLGKGVVTVTGEGGKLTLAGVSGTTGKLAVGEVELSTASNTLVFNRPGTASDAYRITGLGGVEIGSAVELLNESNSFTGGVTINSGGILTVNKLGTIGAEGDRKLTFNGGSVHFGPEITSDAGVELARNGNSTIVVTTEPADTDFIFSGALTGKGGVTLGSSGTNVLAGNNTFEGVLNIASGTVQVDELTNLGRGNDGEGATVDIGAFGTLAIAGTKLKDDTDLKLGFANGSALSIVDQNSTFTISQAIVSADSTIEKKGDGRLVLASDGNTIAGVKISGGTLTATDAKQLGSEGAVTGEVLLNGGFLNVGQGAAGGISSSADLDITFAGHAVSGETLLSGFDIDAGNTFSLYNPVTKVGSGLGTVTLVKKGEGRLFLAGNPSAVSEQVNNIIEAGTLLVYDVAFLGTDANVTLAGGVLGIYGGELNSDADIDITLATTSAHIGLDIATTNDTFTLTKAVTTTTGHTTTGQLIKRGYGTLVLQHQDIAYDGGTVVEGGVLKVDDADGKFRFKDGKYTVNRGTLEADVSDLTITELAGSGKTGAPILGVDGSYELEAGTIVIAQGENGGVNRESTLTLKSTSGDRGFWGKIIGFFTAGADADTNPRVAAGTLDIDAAGTEVVLTGNASEVGTVNVKAGTLRVNNGLLPVNDLLGAPDTTHYGSLTANAVNITGTEAARATLAGSGSIVAPVTVGQYGSLLGNQAGTLTIRGDVTFNEGATVELSGFTSHYNPIGADVIENQYFHVEGTVSAAEAGTSINLNNDAIDPGVYRVFSSTNTIVGGDLFAIGTVGDGVPADSVSLVLTGEGRNLDLEARTGDADVRYWNATPGFGATSWTADGSDWTNISKGDAGKLHLVEDSSVVGVFGHTDFPQQGGEVEVIDANYLTQGLQFVAGDWWLSGEQLELRGGAANTDYFGVTSIDTGAGIIAVANELTGDAALRKTGVGTLALSGVNTYAGGTIIESGTLSIEADANLGEAGSSVTLNGAGATLALAHGLVAGDVLRQLVVNQPSNTSGSVNLTSTIDLGGNTARLAGLTGNGLLNIANGGAVFAGSSTVDFGGTVNVSTGASLSVEGEGSIDTAIINGTLHGSFGHTLTIDTLNLASTAEVALSLPADSNGAVTAFKGTNAVLDGEISALDLPTGYTVGDNGASLYVFDYANRSGTIAVSDAVKAQYVDSNFTFGGVVNGYLVLNSKTTPTPQPGEGETVDVDPSTDLGHWTNSTFVDGRPWNGGTATFNGNGAGNPVNVEGQVRIAGLTINGESFLFEDAVVSGQPGSFLLRAATGSTTVEFTVAANGSATITIPLGSEEVNGVATTNFAKKGEGHLELSGNSSDYKGVGTVEAGTLYVTGDFSNGTFEVTGGELRVNGVVHKVTVGPNGTLEGLFTGAADSRSVNIGTLEVNGGTLKPGNSPGTLRVGGLSQTAGVIAFERGDKIEVLAGVGGTPDGRAIFSKAADGTQVDLRLTTDTRSYTYGNNYTFVTAENGVTFTTADAVKVTEVGNGRLFSSFRAEAVGTEGRFYLQRDRGFGTQAWSGNQLAVAGALESLTPADLRSSRGAIYDAIASASNDEAHLVRAAFDQLSGEIHASVKGVLVEESRHLREATTNRTRAALSGSATAAPGQIVHAPEGSNIALWGQAYGSWGSTKSTANSAKLDRSTGGFVLGFDSAVADNWRLGIAGGYAKSDIKSNANLSKADVDNYNLAIYGGSQFGDLGLRFGFGHTWHRLDTERQLNVLGLRDINQGKYDARTLQLYAEAGYEVKFEAASIEPFVNLAYVHHHSDSFVERGLGLGSALTSRGQDESTGFSTLGLRVSKNFDLSGAKGTATGTLGWRHAFGDVDPTGIFSANGTSLFAISGAPVARNALVLGVGLDVEIAHGTSLGVSYNGQVGDKTSDHGVKGNFSVRF